MCNRFAIENPEHVELWSKEMLEWEWRDIVSYYNMAPNERHPVVLRDSHQAPVGLRLNWGIKFNAEPQLYTNARREKALTNPAWKRGVQERRCAVLADGFFEFREMPNGKKKPYFFRRKNRQPFAFPGIYFCPQNGIPDAFVFFTSDPNELMAPIHDRHPVILDETNVRDWLRPGPLSDDEVKNLLQVYPSDRLEAFRVTTVVNSVRNKSPDCVRKMSEEELSAEAIADTNVTKPSRKRVDDGQLELL